LDAPEPAATIPAAPEPPVFEPGVVRHDLEVLPLPVAFPEPEPQASSEPLPLFEAQPEPQASSEPEAQPFLTAYPQSEPRPEVDTLPGLEAGPRPATPLEAEPEPLIAAFPEPEITPTPPPPDPSDLAELEATTQQLSVVVLQAPLAPAFDFTGEIEPPAVMPPVVSVLPAQPADNAEVAELKRRLEELTARLDSLVPVAKLDSISEKLDSLASRVQEVEKEGGGLPARLGQLETHIEETAARLTTEAADRSDENARRVASLAASLGQLRDTLSDRLETEGQSVRQQIESLMAGREEDRGQLLASVRSFADEKLSAAPVVTPRALDDLRTELSGQLSMLRSDLESLASALAVPTDGIHGLKVALKTTQEELAALAATVAKEAGEKATIQKSLDEAIEQRFEAFRTVQDEHFLGLRTRLDDIATALQQETLALTSAASAFEDATGRRFEALEQTTTELMTVDSVTALLSQKLQGLRADIASHLTDLQKSNAEAMEAVRKDVRNGLAQAAAAEGRSRQLLLTLRQALEPFEKLSSSSGKETADPPASPDAP
jgi:chromosome segregation ATPase